MRSAKEQIAAVRADAEARQAALHTQHQQCLAELQQAQRQGVEIEKALWSIEGELKALAALEQTVAD